MFPSTVMLNHIPQFRSIRRRRDRSCPEHIQERLDDLRVDGAADHRAYGAVAGRARSDATRRRHFALPFRGRSCTLDKARASVLVALSQE